MHIATLAAYGIALLSVAYAVVFLGLVRGQPENVAASVLANVFVGISGLLATVVTVAVGERISGVAGRWLALVGVGWALLSATHGWYAAIADAQGLPSAGLSPTDPRGFATFGLAGVWVIVLGVCARAGDGALPRGLGTLAIALGADLVLLFAATVTGQGTLVLVSGGLASVVLGPVLWAWLGRCLASSPATR